MSRRSILSRTDICQLCECVLARQARPRRAFLPQRSLNSSTFSNPRRLYSQKPPKAALNGDSKLTASESKYNAKTQGPHLSEAEHVEIFGMVKTACNAFLSSDRLPSEDETMNILRQCERISQLLVLDQPSPSVTQKDTSTSSLLSLDESDTKTIIPHKLSPNLQKIVGQISELAYSIIKCPFVYITPDALAVYVGIQATLGRPETLPEVFALYANKPLPREGTNPIQYSKQNPNKVANVIPPVTAEKALQAAIAAKQLVTAMDIIQTSYTTKASHRAKFVRKGLLPATGLAVAPVAAYTVASQLAEFQTAMDPAMATQVAFVGLLAYVGFTATVGVVAVTTANDQMERVTWASGVPLRERWIREEERAAIDKVAVAWGFREAWRRGEEEGEDWDALREWIGRRAMMLDRVELLEGME